MDHWFTDSLNQSSVQENSLGDLELRKPNGQLDVAERSSILPGQKSVFDESNNLIADSRTNPFFTDQTDIYQDNQKIGQIKNDVFGHETAYNAQGQAIAYVNPEGNINQIYTHYDPLSLSDQVLLKKLKLSNES